MMIGLIGRKAGMTRIFTEEGVSVPVTVIEIEPNRVTRVKRPETDGYWAIQVTCGKRRATRVNKSQAGHYSKAGVEAGEGLWEFRLQSELEGVGLASELKVDLFANEKKVDIAGITKGKGFAGVVKRHNFSMQDATHGNSRSHRAAGSTGQNQTPGRVYKGKRMAGHMGNVRATAQNLEVVRIDIERNLLLVKGAVPGSAGSGVVVRPAAKKRK